MASFESLQRAQIPFCSFCKLEKITEWKCVDCNKHICYECKKFHRWKINWTNHKIVCTKSASAERLSDRPDPTETCCTEHKHFTNSNYCLDCNQLVCPECIALGSIHFKHDIITIIQCREKSLEELKNVKTKIEREVLPNIEDKMKSLIELDISFEKKYENEKKKIEDQATMLIDQITRSTNILLVNVENVLKKNKDVIEKEKFQLGKIQKELINEIKNIISKTMKDDNVKEMVQEIENISSRIQKNSNPPVTFPQEMITFQPVKNTTADINTILGRFKNHNMATDSVVKYRMLSYNMFNFARELSFTNSLMVAKDGTIYVAGFSLCIEFKPNEKPEVKKLKYGILDMPISDLSQLLFITSVDNSIQTKDETDEIKVFYTLPNSNNVPLALCVCRDGRVLVLYVKEVPSLRFKNECPIKLKIDMLTKNGTFIKTIKCDFTSRWNALSKERIFKMRENINGHICILSEEQSKVTDLSQDGMLNWEYTSYSSPYDMDTTQVGNIIVLGKYEKDLKVLNCDGKLVAVINLGLSKVDRYRLGFKNYRELVIINRNDVYIAKLSFAI